MNSRAGMTRERGHLALLTALMEESSRGSALDPTWAGSVLARIVAALDAQAAVLMRLDRDGSPPLRCRAHIGLDLAHGLEIPAHEGLLGHCLRTRETRLLRGPVPPDDPVSALIGAPRGRYTLLCAPLAAMEHTLGVVLLISRIDGEFGDQDRETLSALAAAAALALVNTQLAEERVVQERLQRELELAGQVQRNLLPREVPAQSPVHGYNRPARGVSGDFYDLVPLHDGRVVFALADVSGKGMNAALIMVKAATLFRSWARRVAEPGRLLARIEAELCETMSMGMFVTMVVGLYDPRTRDVRLSNAGHEPPLLRDAQGRYTAYPATDPPLGVVGKLEKNRYRETLIALDDGTLYLYTDGATEGRLDHGAAAGSQGVRALIEQHCALPAAQRLEAIAAHYGDDLRDDLTLLVVEDALGAGASRPARARRRSARVLVEQFIPAQADQLKIVRRLVQAASGQAGAGTEWAADLALAVDEACQNIIRHGYAGQARGRIRLSVLREGETLKVELEDDAPAVAASDCQGRSLDEVRPGGLGTYFMHRLTDGVRFLKPRALSGNRLVLSKRLHPKLPKDPSE